MMFGEFSAGEESAFELSVKCLCGDAPPSQTEVKMTKMNHELRNRLSRMDHNGWEYGYEIDIRRERITVPSSVSAEPQTYPPKLSFLGNSQVLMLAIEYAGINGYWRKLGDQHQFRSDNGGVLNWWPRTGTINFQGNRSDAGEIYNAINRIALDRENGHKSNRRKSACREEVILILRIPELV